MDSNLPPEPPPVPPAPAPPPSYVPPARVAPSAKRNRGLKAAVWILSILLLLSLLGNAFGLLDVFTGSVGHTRRSGPDLAETTMENNGSQNKILVVPVEGIISSDMSERSNYGMVEYIRDQLD